MKKQPKPSLIGKDSSSPKAVMTEKKKPFPIVGIGASAGGLEALDQFLRQVPANCGMAFVIIQHLDPTNKGALPELLQRTTSMEVTQVKEQMRVKPNCVYVIPPNSEMSILHGVLHLFEPAAPRGLRLPIDIFLRSLADDRQEGSIGVILSGMGSDGTQGIKAIKENAGLALVQEPTTAKFDSMPRSVIIEGLADIVAPAEALPGKIIEYLKYAHIPRAQSPGDERDQSGLERVLVLLLSKTGHDFSMYKKNTIYRRIERRMSIHQIDKIAEYVRFLQKNSQEIELLFKDLLIGVTSFFRDPTTWEQLQKKALPTILTSRPDGGTLRAWSVGCSTGEEAYSLAIIFKEALEQVKPKANYTLQIFATDLDQDAIKKARKGFYSTSIADAVSSERLNKFFSKEENGYRVNRDIRDMVTFATQNVIMAPPFTRLDILICRNLMIYLTPELQQKLLPLFHYCLNPDGLLFLGTAETITPFTELFTELDIKSRLFQRSKTMPVDPVTFPPSFIYQREASKDIIPLEHEPNLQSLAEQLLLQYFSPPAVLVNDKGDILYISGRTGRYLEPASGKANWNIFVMLREELRFNLGITFWKALRQKEAATVKGLKVGKNDDTKFIDITVQALEMPEALRGMVMIIFTEVAAPLEKKKTQRRSKTSDNADVFELEQEVQQLREGLQTTREEMQSSQEELKSTNEELQSTNEELTTSKEEMQSLNEEMQTVNAEQLSKLEELSQVNNDMRSLLNSTEILIVFLDKELHVRRFTTGVNKIFKLMPRDLGRPLSDIASGLLYPDMIEEAREVLRTLVFLDKQITTTDGRWFTVRIMPYRTMEDVIDGVVITFTDTTEAKRLEGKLREEITKLKRQLDVKK